MKLRPSHFQHAFYLKSINIAIIYTRQKGTRVRKKRKNDVRGIETWKKFTLVSKISPRSEEKSPRRVGESWAAAAAFSQTPSSSSLCLFGVEHERRRKKTTEIHLYCEKEAQAAFALLLLMLLCLVLVHIFHHASVYREAFEQWIFFVSVSQNMRKKKEFRLQFHPRSPFIQLASPPNFLSYTMNGNTFRFGGMGSENRVGCWYSHSSSSRIDDGGTGHTSGEEIRARGKIEQSQGKKISNEVECADDERKNVWRKNGERSAELIWIQQRLASPPSKRTYIFGRSEWVSGCWRFFWILFFFAFLLLLICPTVHCLA